MGSWIGSGEETLRYSLFRDAEEKPNKDNFRHLFDQFDVDRDEVLNEFEHDVFFDNLYDYISVRENNNYPLSTKGEMVAGWKTEFQVKEKDLTRDVFEAIVKSICTDRKKRSLNKKLIRIDDYGTDSVAQRAKFIPMRMTKEERDLLLLLEGALDISEYTNHVDVLSHNRGAIIERELAAMMNFIAGLIVSQQFNLGQGLFTMGDRVEKIDLFQKIFEIGRRYKIMNPDKMRTSYGKLMWLLTDTQQHCPILNKEPRKSSLRNISTLSRFLQTKALGEDLLADPDLITASACIITKDKYDVAAAVKQRNEAKERLIKKYCPAVVDEKKTTTTKPNSTPTSNNNNDGSSNANSTTTASSTNSTNAVDYKTSVTTESSSTTTGNAAKTSSDAPIECATTTNDEAKSHATEEATAEKNELKEEGVKEEETKSVEPKSEEKEKENEANAKSEPSLKTSKSRINEHGDLNLDESSDSGERPDRESSSDSESDEEEQAENSDEAVDENGYEEDNESDNSDDEGDDSAENDGEEETKRGVSKPNGGANEQANRGKKKNKRKNKKLNAANNNGEEKSGEEGGDDKPMSKRAMKRNARQGNAKTMSKKSMRQNENNKSNAANNRAQKSNNSKTPKLSKSEKKNAKLAKKNNRRNTEEEEEKALEREAAEKSRAQLNNNINGQTAGANSNIVKTPLTLQDLTLCIDSLSDANSYTLSNRHYVDRMIDFLFTFFSPDQGQPNPSSSAKEASHSSGSSALPLSFSSSSNAKFSLAIKNGKDGSCLTHGHGQQFKFVQQTLQLWRDVMEKMMRLWIYADYDILNSQYRLSNTGQGLNRMQSPQNVRTEMRNILTHVQSRVGGWVGLSVIHLGDVDVPNALVFIDKYSQIPRILGPVVKALDFIDDAEHDKELNIFLTHYGGAINVKRMILCDFFKHAFDGSGDDGGSCIDGRLTSAWNWCQQLNKKPFYSIFLLSGFIGFDGSFKK